MRQFPAFFNLEGARIVVFGDGEEAARKLRLLVSSPAELVQVGDVALAEFAERVVHSVPSATRAVLESARLAIIADVPRRAEILAEVRARGIPVNVVDAPELCDFTVPSIIDRGEVVAAIGSGGNAPVLVKALREKLEAIIPQRAGEFASLAGKLRGFVSGAIPDQTARRRFWERALAGPAAAAAYAGD
ncbi:MAG TPA: bifunctional precorrin-2 dehydrogenase/sirohydrochlorin ferrochelatase, partial [Hyphomonas sp.]|nr:bifunctional precorrin-2 dehydrogenase/sirohydrochlorin ferrochelatase [Hyphomonas sp.]